MSTLYFYIKNYKIILINKEKYKAFNQICSWKDAFRKNMTSGKSLKPPVVSFPHIYYKITFL